jgi:hypothetical protein
MTPIIDVAPRAEDNPLAVRLASMVRDNLDRCPHKRRDFDALRGSVAIVADDTRDATTLRFDHGRLTVHDGIVGVPDVTIRGRETRILELGGLPVSRRTGFFPLDRNGLAGARALASSLRSGELHVYGLGLRMPLVIRLLRVLSLDG